jgi:hypothetical protein
MLKQVLLRNTEGTVQRVEDAKVTVFGCGIEASATEAKGTVLIRSAEELMNYNKSEEKLMEEVRVATLKVDSPNIQRTLPIYNKNEVSDVVPLQSYILMSDYYQEGMCILEQASTSVSV